MVGTNCRVHRDGPEAFQLGLGGENDAAQRTPRLTWAIEQSVAVEAAPWPGRSPVINERSAIADMDHAVRPFQRLGRAPSFQREVRWAVIVPRL